MVILLNITKGEPGDVGILSQGVENPNWKRGAWGPHVPLATRRQTKEAIEYLTTQEAAPSSGEECQVYAYYKVKSSFLIPCWVSYPSRALSGLSQEPYALVILRVYFLIRR